jgi:hypothetical protein
MAGRSFNSIPLGLKPRTSLEVAGSKMDYTSEPSAMGRIIISLIFSM